MTKAFSHTTEHGAPLVIFRVPIKDGKSVIMQADSNLGNQRRHVVVVNADKFLRLWRDEPNPPSRNLAKSGPNEWKRDSKYPGIAHAFAQGAASPIPLAEVVCPSLNSQDPPYVAFTNGITRTIWLLANGATTFPVECQDLDQALRLHKLACTEIVPPWSVANYYSATLPTFDQAAKKQSMNRYDIERATYLIDGYYAPTPAQSSLGKHIDAFEQAKATTLKHHQKSMEIVRELGAEDFFKDRGGRGSRIQASETLTSPLTFEQWQSQQAPMSKAEACATELAWNAAINEAMRVVDAAVVQGGTTASEQAKVIRTTLYRMETWATPDSDENQGGPTP